MSRPGQVEQTEHVEADDPRVRPSQIRCVRSGHGANCSSIGSVVDTLFAAATVGAALFAAVVAALASEPVRVVGSPSEDGRAGPAPSEPDDSPHPEQPASTARRSRTTTPPKPGRS